MSSEKAIDASRFENILESVRKPSSYLGSEPNSVHKNYNEVEASIALVFPDLYEIGMSHLGLKILYHIINSRPDLAAERVFAPDVDFAELIKQENAPLMSLESRRPLSLFDVVGFTIPYELSYTTMLYVLDLAQIPRYAKERGPGDPLIIGGGAGVYNPEPIAPFFDLFVLGDGEYVTMTILRKAAEMRHEQRSEVLVEMAKIDGVYVPSLFEITYADDGSLATITPKLADYDKAKRVFIPTLTESPYPVDMVIPFGETVHDRVSVEIDRGCTQGCRFCQAGTTYRPVRERTPEETIRIMDEVIEKTGYDDISVTSLSAGDYSKIGPLLTALMDRYEEKKISLSLPSLRSGAVTDEIVEQVKRVKKTGFTITAEAGSQRLRDVLNKKATEDEILGAASKIVGAGWRTIKLYFMIGLPTETMDDIDAIYELADKLSRLKVNGKRFMTINLAASNFVPKAHTAFQWYGQDEIATLVEKKERLFSLIKSNKKIRFKWHNPKMSHIEAAMSRGDRRLSAVIEKAYEKGQILDAWSERFDFDRWKEAFEDCGLDSAFFANRDFELEAPLPWDHIDTGLTKKYFRREYDLALKGTLTSDCKTEECIGCGLDPSVCFEPYDLFIPPMEESKEETEKGRFWFSLTYERLGLSRFFSHLEMKAMIERAFTISKLDIAYTEGFSPHPRISYGPALPVGTESEEEFLTVELKTAVDLSGMIDSLNKTLPAGLKFISGAIIGAGEKKTVAITEQRYELFFADTETIPAIARGVKKFTEAEKIIINRERKNKITKIDLKEQVADMIFSDATATLRFSIIPASGATAKPGDVITAITGKMPLPPYKIIKKRWAPPGR